jgi:D-alanyl-D-alanine carboxypeptidase/D-alanyl-D-alanine-endopeptidase (penicillin-binding protein 4)
MAGLAPQSAYAVADLQGRLLEGCNIDHPLVPASILKIATITAAMDILGPEYRFRTGFFLDSQQNLFIKGYGDPSLVSEEIAVIAQQLHQRGLKRVNLVCIDATAFALEHQVPGQAHSDNPYDAPVGPLSVNFNALSLEKTGTGIRSGEPQTPTLPLMADLGRTYPAGRYRINVCSGGCNADQRMARYAGELFVAQFRRQGIAVSGYGGLRSVPAGCQPLYTHYSRQNLSAISQSTLAYSSNFMANLIFLASGAEEAGYPATWAKARKAVQRHLALQMGQEAKNIVQVEGAGLSRENRVTAQAILQLLQAFRPYAGLLRLEQEGAMKTGTLTGVYTLAGYLPGGESFVILLNQPTNNRSEVLNRIRIRVASRGSAVAAAMIRSNSLEKSEK